MALAATFAAQGMRPASFLPAIKCSSCGEEIEIAAMGDHICSKAPPSPHSQPASLTNAFTIRQLNAHGHMPHAPSPLQQQQQQTKPVSLPKTRVRAPTVTSQHLPAPKAVRPPPPRINAEAANMPFLAPRPPRSDSPPSPALSVRSGSSQGSRPAPPLRSMTSPMPRVFDPRPPSPEMSGNLDCAFPPFIPASGGGGSRPGTSSGRKMSAGSERGGSRGREGVEGGKSGSQREPSRPRNGSPMGDGGEIAGGQSNMLKSGPFDPNRRPSDQAGIAQAIDRRRPRKKSHTIWIRIIRGIVRAVVGQQQQQQRAKSRDQQRGKQRRRALALNHRASPLRRRRRNARARSQLQPPETRHARGTTSLALAAEGLRPPGPTERYRCAQRSPTLPALISPPLESPMDPALQGRQIPGRSATEPWRPSPAPGGPSRPTISRTNTMPEAREKEPVDVLLPPVPTLFVPGPSDKDYDPYRPTSPAPVSRSRSKSNAAPAQFKAYAPPPLPPPPTQTLAPTQYKSANPGSSLRPHTPQPIPVRPPPPQQQQQPNPHSTPTPTATPLLHRPTPTTKPTCRGCRHPIAGKSVKAADGRLTGRWHKPCFTCRTCARPFTTADFYVIGNEPYCEQHYHEANGSLCWGCGGGIEGVYLSTSSSSATFGGSGGSGSAGAAVVDRKFHPRCFTCCECRVVLAEDYFEIGGRVFCERDALAAMRGLAGRKTEVLGSGSGSETGAGVGLKGKGMGGAGGLSVPDRKALTAERRTTRLMMM
ncbi:hypothetical protein LTR54_008511 [Friedmanniomyces endolithicus]|nr:hypothetical protein LTR54_008511 [Friedmanniomyces endolithicus]